MRQCVKGRVPPAAFENRKDRWWETVKASDELLDPIFEDFFNKLHIENLMRKTHYHRLANLVPRAEIAPDVVVALDAIVKVSESANAARVDDET